MPRGSPRARAAFAYRGPFFERDPLRTLAENIRDLMERVARTGGAYVRSELDSAGPEGAEVRPFVQGRVRSVSGTEWRSTAVVSVSTPHMDAAGAKRTRAIAAGRGNPIGSDGRNRGTTRGAEGKVRAFRRVATAMRRAFREIDLTRGMN